MELTWRLTVVVACLLAAVTAQVPQCAVSYSSAGLEFRVPGDNLQLVSFHYNINEPLHEVFASQHAVDVNTKTGNDFVLTDPSVHLKPGDKVNYWFVAIGTDGQGHQLTEQSWTYVGGVSATAAPPTTTATRPTTTTTTTTTTTSPPGVSGHPTHTTHAQVTHTAAPQGTHTTAPLTNTGTGTGGSSSSSLNGFTDFGGSSQFVSGGSGTGCGFCNYGPGKGDGYVDDRTCTTFPCLIFEDNFDFLNMRVWEHEITAGGGGNWEFQYYTNNRTNSYTRDGVLYIKPTLTSDRYGMEFLEHGSIDLWGGSPADVCTSNAFWGCKRDGQPGQIVDPIQSARLRSSRGFNFRYGKVEVEAKLPTGDWLWPAIWMLPRWNAYGNWPASGEIDIMESRGNLNYHDPQGNSQGADSYGSTLHFGADYFTNKWPTAHKEFHTQSGTFANGFHKYGVEWTNTSIIFTLDGQEMYKVEPGAGGFWQYGGLDQLQGYDNPWLGGSRMAPFDQEYFIILNVAVGGVGFFSDDNVNSPNPKPWRDGAGHEADHFWGARTQWYPTWHPDTNNGEDAALKVNYVKVWKTQPDH